MKTFVILTVVSLGSLAWTASVPVDLSNQNRDPRVVWNVFVPEETHSEDRSVGFKKAREVHMYDLHQNDKNDLEESDVYWRPWRGTMPRDAVVGAYGKTDCGSETPIYMAQVLHKAASNSGILPAQMFKKSKAVIVSFGRREYRYKENIKILCAEDSNILTWVPINQTRNLSLTPNKDCVIAGAELTFNTFFGRSNYEDETVIGKVLYHTNTMYFPYYGEEKYLTTDFEILCYQKAIETRRTEAIKRKLEEEKKKIEEAEAIRKKQEEEKKREEENEANRMKLDEGKEKEEKTTEVPITSMSTEAVKQDQAEGIDRRIVYTNPLFHNGQFYPRIG